MKFSHDNKKFEKKSKTCVIPGVGGVLPREGSAPGCAPGPPKLPLDEPFVAYSLDDLAADACNGTDKSTTNGQPQPIKELYSVDKLLKIARFRKTRVLKISFRLDRTLF